MKYNELDITPHTNPRRVGRGIAGGQGKTAGRGTKGQNSRTGSSRRPGFAGGQNPLMQQLPKLRGFKSKKIPMEVVYTGQLNTLTAATVDNFSLADAGLITHPYVQAKLIIKGDVTKKFSVQLQAASKNAIEAIQKAGGTFAIVPQIGRQSKNPKR